MKPSKLSSGVLILAGLIYAQIHQWPCFQHDPQHTGCTPNRVGDSYREVLICPNEPVSDKVTGSPVISEGGDVYIQSQNETLYSFGPYYPYLGLRWLCDLDSLGSDISANTPALDDGSSIYLCTNRRLCKFSDLGPCLWSWPHDGHLTISHSPTIGGDGWIYFGANKDSFYGLSPDGAEFWGYDVEGDISGAPAIGPYGDIAIATKGGTQNYLYCFTPGREFRWRYPLTEEADGSSPMIDPDSVCYVGAGHYLYAVNADGTLKWRSDSLSASIHCTPALGPNGAIYVVAGTRLYAFPHDGTHWTWRVSIGTNSSTPTASPVVDGDGTVYVGSQDSVFWAINPDSSVKWSYHTGGGIQSSAAISNNSLIYVGGNDHKFYCIVGTNAAVTETRRACPRQLTLAVTPVILTDWSVATYFLPGPAACRLGLYDVTGKLVTTLTTGYHAAGASSFIVHRSSLSAGIYLVRFETDEGNIGRKLIVK